MQGPDHGNLFGFEVFKEHREVQIGTVNVVQVDDFRIKGLQLADEIVRGAEAEKTGPVREARKADVHKRIQPVSDADGGNVRGGMLARMAENGLMPLPPGQPAQFHRNAAGAERGGYIDLRNSHGAPPFKTRASKKDIIM